MIVHTPLDWDGVQQIAAAYQLAVRHFKPAGLGSGNTNFLLDTDQGKMILTIVEDLSHEEVLILTRVLLGLERHHFCTTRLILRPGGEATIRYCQKTAFLKSYIPGEVRFDLNENMLEQLGQALGQLNEIPVPEYLATNIYYELPKFSEVIGLGIDTEYERWLSERCRSLRQGFPENVPRGLIHGDLFCDNVLFEKGQLKAIIDLELACHFYKAFDIGMAIVGLCVVKNKPNLKKARALVRGYQQVRKLEIKERQSLQGFAEYAAVKTSNWRFWRYCYYQPTPEKKHKHREMMQVAEGIRNIPKQIFISAIFDL